MEKSCYNQLVVKCTNGNPAVNLCATVDCKHPSLMCEATKCSCQQLHDSCPLMSTLNKITKILRTKGTKQFRILPLVYDWYNSQLKLITLEMEELRIKIDKQQIILEGDQEKLYSYLIEGKSALVFPSMVAETIASSKLENEKQNLQKQKINQNLQRLRKRIQDILTETKNMTNSGLSLSSFRFNEQLSHPNISIVNNHIIQQSKPLSRFPTALLQPEILKCFYNTIKIELKMNKLKSTNIMFGVCQIKDKNQIKQMDFYSKLQYGSFCYINVNNVFLGKAQGHRNQKSNINFYETNDIVQIQYEKQDKKVTVRNITKNTESTSYIAIDEHLPLYFAVILYDQQSQVELISVTQS